MSEQAGDVAVPAIVLVEPQLGENIGAAARAMANFGLADLRLVNPRDGWPSDKARAAASGADHVIDAVGVFPSVQAAVAELRFVYATTARGRDMAKPVRGPRQAAETLRARARGGEATGILFGRERWGLTNEELGLADEIVTFPVNPAFASLNLAQSVLLMSYEWMVSGLEGGALPTRVQLPELDDSPAPKADLIGLMEHLEAALEPTGYFKTADLRPRQVQNLRALLQRAGFTEPEIKVLRGVVAALEGRKKRHQGADSE
ncbi:MAG TPA: RNA methyltransferase [Afifellaceae bacterium]|nr:RNA methyltransferase [Afifellaceae bacterium]